MMAADGGGWHGSVSLQQTFAPLLDSIDRFYRVSLITYDFSIISLIRRCFGSWGLGGLWRRMAVDGTAGGPHNKLLLACSIPSIDFIAFH